MIISIVSCYGNMMNSSSSSSMSSSPMSSSSEISSSSYDHDTKELHSIKDQIISILSESKRSLNIRVEEVVDLIKKNKELIVLNLSDFTNYLIDLSGKETDIAKAKMLSAILSEDEIFKLSVDIVILNDKVPLSARTAALQHSVSQLPLRIEFRKKIIINKILNRLEYNIAAKIIANLIRANKIDISLLFLKEVLFANNINRLPEVAKYLSDNEKIRVRKIIEGNKSDPKKKYIVTESLGVKCFRLSEIRDVNSKNGREVAKLDPYLVKISLTHPICTDEIPNLRVALTSNTYWDLHGRKIVLKELYEKDRRIGKPISKEVLDIVEDSYCINVGLILFLISLIKDDESKALVFHRICRNNKMKIKTKKTLIKSIIDSKIEDKDYNLETFSKKTLFLETLDYLGIDIEIVEFLWNSGIRRISSDSWNHFYNLGLSSEVVYFLIDRLDILDRSKLLFNIIENRAISLIDKERIISQILTKGVDIDFCNREMLLHIALDNFNGDTNIIKMLCGSGVADIDVREVYIPEEVRMFVLENTKDLKKRKELYRYFTENRGNNSSS